MNSTLCIAVAFTAFGIVTTTPSLTYSAENDLTDIKARSRNGTMKQ